MESSYTEFPRLVMIENKALKKLPEVLDKLDIHAKVVIVADTITKDIAGNKIKEDLSGSELVVIENSRMEDVEHIKKSAQGFDCIIGVGGGKVIDPAKMAALQLGKAFISVPTAPSHDGLCSENVSLLINGRFHSLKARVPLALVADIDILKAAPYRLIASGAADLIAKFTAHYDWNLAREKTGEEYNEYAAELALTSARLAESNAKAIKELEDKGIKNLIWGLVLSGTSMSMVSSSRPGSGAEHMFSHALDALHSEKGIKGALHGEQCGFGSILTAYLQERDNPNWERIRDILKEVGAPTTTEELGVKKDLVVEALARARDIRNRYTILNEKPVTKEEALKICEAVGI